MGWRGLRGPRVSYSRSQEGCEKTDPTFPLLLELACSYGQGQGKGRQKTVEVLFLLVVSVL